MQKNSRIVIILILMTIILILVIIILILPIFSMKKVDIVYGKERFAEKSCGIKDSTTTHFPE